MAHDPGNAAECFPSDFTMVPERRTPWAYPRTGTPRARPKSSAALGSELAEVFRIQVLQIRFQLFRIQRLGILDLAGIHRGQLQQVFLGEDRGVETQRDGDRIR